MTIAPTQEALMEDAIQEQVELAMAPLKGVHPPEVEEEVRKMLLLALDTDPDAQRLLRATVRRRMGELKESDKMDLRSLGRDPEAPREQGRPESDTTAKRQRPR
jgi:hypothetical protein